MTFSSTKPSVPLVTESGLDIVKSLAMYTLSVTLSPAKIHRNVTQLRVRSSDPGLAKLLSIASVSLTNTMKNRIDKLFRSFIIA